MTKDERVAFVSAHIQRFVPEIALATIQASGAIRESALAIVNRWEAELREAWEFRLKTD